MQGEPRGTRRLSPQGPLLLGDLPRGIWRLQVSTGVLDLMQLATLHLDGERCRIGFPADVLSRSR